MSNHLSFDYSHAINALVEGTFRDAKRAIRDAKETLHSGSGPGSDFLGWIDLPIDAKNHVQSITELRDEIRSKADVFIVVGIGGSYLGARSVIDACTPFHHRDETEILYVGHNMSGEYLASVLAYCEEREVHVNVISKSGTTTEPALAFRALKNWMEHKYGRREAARRIIATTDATRGALRSLASQEGYRALIIPDNVGGRFSVLTPVGLLPIAVAGLDISALLDGATWMRSHCLDEPFDSNAAMTYAALRLGFYREGKSIEIFATFLPELQYIADWWKQLFGESEGKEGKGVFPATAVYSTDLHSMGQYLQQGPRILFETFLTVAHPLIELLVPRSDDDSDGMNYLAGKSFSSINGQALLATAAAHAEGGVPNMTITLPALSIQAIGELLFFFEYAVALGGYALGVNPFDQPGVENYKRNMFALLNKPGYEEMHSELQKRLRSGHRFII